MRRSPDGSLRRLIAPLVALAWAAGCGGGSAPTGPTADRAARSGESVIADLRDPLLWEHNARFFGGRTFRWVPPVPAFVLTPEPAVNAVMQEQLEAWETTLADAGGGPLFAPQQVSSRQLPSRGIVFTISDLGGPTLGTGDPFVEAATSGRGPTALARQLPQLAIRALARRLEIPEVLASGEIQRCQVTLDPVVTAATAFVIRAVIRHELGHCLGFLGHLGRGLMRARCCSLDMTRDLFRFMQRLYRMPPGSAISR